MVFSGTVNSDFLKLISVSMDNKEKQINFASSDFASLRDSLINYAKAVYPLDYNNFSESDFGVFLIELMAAVGHIQSIKSDYLANESFLRTARSRNSVKKLLELVGVRMKGPIAAAANATLTIPLESITSPSSVTISPENRIVTVNSPEDGGSLTYTIYKVNSNGSIDLDSNTTSLEFDVSADGGNLIVSNAILLEGAFVIETGVFDSPEALKSVTLSQSPYIEKSAQVFITSDSDTVGVYTEEENIYFASGGSDKIFQVLTDDNFVATVVFGDSTLGKSPSVGDSYTISYRIGGGSRGNLTQGYISAPMQVTVSDGSTESIQATVTNSTAFTGGSDAETVAHAKKYAPLTFRRQDRLVTLDDYKSYVNTFISNYGSTGKANAVVRRAYSSANIIDIFVLEKASDLQLRRATPEYKRQLLESIQTKKMLTDEPVIVDGLIRTLDLIVTINLDSKYKKFESDIKNKAKNKILEYFSVDNIDFGEPIIPQDLIKYVLDLVEIRYMTVNNIDGIINIDFNEIVQLNNLTINVVYV